MNYISVREAAERWEMTPRRVQVLCNDGRIDGAQRVGNVWTIPENADKPIDARKKIIAPKAKINSNITIERIWAMPNKNTFEIKPIHDLIVDEITDGIWIDPFANRNKLASITNDLSTEFDTDYHLDALDFLKMFDTDSVDGVLYDPPYSPRQVSECYNNVGYNVTWDTTKASFWGNHKREISRIVKIGGKVITFGWNSGGIGYKYGFEIQKVLLVPHGGWHNDTICTVEIKTHEGEISTVKDSEKMGAHKSEKTTDTDKKLISLLQQLPENYWDFKEDDTREYTHGIHSYPAMMVCPISRNIIKIMKGIMPISSLFDPFSGSGTVLVEGLLSGIPNVVGNDINPLALFLAKVKTTQLDISMLQSAANKLLDSIRNRYEQYILQIDSVDDVLTNAYELDLTAKHGWGDNAPHYLTEYCEKNNVDINIPSFKNIGYWFKPRVILLLQIIKDEINKIEDKNMRNFAFVAFSESIRLVSNRRNGEFKMFRMPPVKVAKFVPDVINEFSTILQRNIEKMNAFVEACSDTGTNSKVTIFQNNATVLQDVPNESIDLVVTSPPYGDSRTTVAYGEYSRLSLQWLGIDNLSEKEIMGIDKSLMGGAKFRNGFEYTIPSQSLRESLFRIKDKDLERAGDVYSFYNDLKNSIKAVSEKTKIGGYHFWVVGNRTVKGELLKTDVIITEIADSYGLEHVYTIDRNIINKVMPSLNSPTNESGVKAETMTNEHIVVLRKR
jgi:16S rRNA G966 N2-methylase RsmD